MYNVKGTQWEDTTECSKYSREPELVSDNSDSFIINHSKIHLNKSPRNSELFYKVSYYIKWVTTSWTDSIYLIL